MTNNKRTLRAKPKTKTTKKNTVPKVKKNARAVRRKRKKSDSPFLKALKSTVTPLVLILSIMTIIYILFFMNYNLTGQPIMAAFGKHISESLSMPIVGSNGTPGNGNVAVGIIGFVGIFSLIYGIKKGR